MHGDVAHATDAVLCKADYETYHLSRGDFLTALAGDLLSKMFLFIGFSFSDPNLDYVLGRLHTRHGNNLRKHYKDLQIIEMILSMAGNNAINRWKEGVGVPQSSGGGGFGNRGAKGENPPKEAPKPACTA